MKVIISGGGTGGHVYPAIAVATRLRERFPDTEILFVGALGKLEMEKVPAAGFRIKGLRISGFHRKLTLRNLGFPVKLMGSLVKARSILRRYKPDVVAGFGGYASGPTLYMAGLLGIPAIIQEQNSYPGVTNRLLARRVERICVAYDGMEKYFPPEKIRVTGNPVRSDLQSLESKRTEALKFFGLDPDKKTLFLFGGSLGARTLNEAMYHATELLAGCDDIQVLWQLGKLYAEQYQKSETAMLAHVHALPYVDRMDLAYAAADVVICRAGASTISELCIAGMAAILVPSPNVAEDHQTKNARALTREGAARIVKDSDAVKSVIGEAVALVRDTKAHTALSQRIKKMGRPDAVDRIVDEVIACVPV
jgi:UDP-N-acetylglucosamine--N-acetylmuramyl-(pentapeptide) pyrophosphoryl-undecaprenol N-acetylglucosamine transferase